MGVINTSSRTIKQSAEGLWVYILKCNMKKTSRNYNCDKARMEVVREGLMEGGMEGLQFAIAETVLIFLV